VPIEPDGDSVSDASFPALRLVSNRSSRRMTTPYRRDRTMSSVDRVTLLTLCAAFLSGAIVSYRGMNSVSDTLVFSGLVVALLAVGFGAVWIVIGQNPLAIF
jgi:hypothetical protein